MALTRRFILLLPSAAAVMLGKTVEVHAPGLVVVRSALSDEEQQYLARSTRRLGQRRLNGFFDADTGTLNAATGRGRIYERRERLPFRFEWLATRAVAQARECHGELPACRPSHCLINYYTSSKGLRWHRDIYANDGDGDKPVINLSVGAACTFGVRVEGKVRKVRLASGDALLFGGPSRFVEHAVLDVHLDERPAWLGEDEAYRLSFTFRDASSVLGREHDFRTFDASNRWFRRTQRAWRPGQALVDVPVQEA